MWNSAVPPPSGVNESCAEFTAPVDVPVVEVAKSADAHSPKRVSLPSIAAPAAWVAVPAPWISKNVAEKVKAAHRVPITPRIA